MVRRCWTRHSDPPRSRPRTITHGSGPATTRRAATRGRALLHHDAAAQRHRQPAHGPRARPHDPGHAGPLPPDARPRRAVAAGHRPCRHRDPDGGRAPAGAGSNSRREIGREAFVEQVWEWKAQSGGTISQQMRRLGASADWSRERFTMDEGLSARGAQGLRRPLPRRPDLQGQAAGQLGLRAADRGLRPRGRADRGRRPSLVHPLPDRGHAGPPHRGRHHPARDHARRHRRRGPSGRRALPAPASAATRSCRWSAAASRSSPTAIPIPRRAPARSRSRRPTTSTTSRSAAGTSWP